MRLYRQLWNSPGLMRVVFAQLLARFPYGMMVLALVMHVQFVFHSYAIAGIALGAETISTAISGPILGRLISKVGIQKVVLPGSLISITAILLIAYTPFAAWWVVLLGVVLGLSQPPIQSAARTVYPKLIKPELRSSIFALDATSQELIWILGPVLATFAAAQISTLFALELMAAIQAVGIAMFLLDRNVKNAKIVRTENSFGHVMKNRKVVLMISLGTLIVASFAGMEIPTVALLGKAISGTVIAVFSIGSIIGGLTLGHRNQYPWAVAGFFLVTTLGYSLGILFPHNALWLAVCWFFGGIAVAPILGTLNAMISVSTQVADAPEAYGWLGTGQLLGYAGAAILVGFLIDNFSAAAGLWVAIGFSFIGLCVSLMTVKSMPKLRSAH